MADSIMEMWRVLEETGGESMTIKLFKHKGDAKPFRLVILVQGEEACEDALDTLRSISADYDRDVADAEGGRS